ncbi:MAG: tRNA uridine-5-carboxymethylaminomethyl(34) synthesis enzyme MnmG [Sphingomonadales bacterium]|nr:tRNA uridine-5-carboxymethylaminomethyl(34) synthesis enzyme MnmG [Sphingomonadales bacterium]MBM3931358.1 tRNA uridine-5-carboxymethylaminomethyl(34) synthesis enzyme MnmG [Sphingomonadales bacterium]
MEQFDYDIIVVGAGHAGCEAAAAAAGMGASTLLISMNLQTIGQMSCNPAMGGVAKGQIVREIDALGGLSGLVSDYSALQFRMLNRSKGPAMWSPRTQNDRVMFAAHWRYLLEQIQGLDFRQDTVKALCLEGDRVKGVITGLGQTIRARKVILTTGTFLNGLIHVGNQQLGGGRAGESASFGITEQLQSMGLASGRMKTGTPPRVDGRSLDYSVMEEQKGDEKPGKFSYRPQSKALEQQMSCWITYTDPQVHEILKEGFEQSPMFTGRIQGIGPRYCPSIEDKINRFAERGRHQLFVEPEGWNTVEVYVNGFSTSLPEEVQVKALRQVKGFEKARIFRPGYAIEYDFFFPTQLKSSLESKAIEGLYLAGQINGTTGYEEAAGQGLIAGMNACRAVKDEEPIILRRSEAYIGVLIDDLVSKGTDEPYRMFTSRAEYRIMLRQDNADLRLSEIGHSSGLLPKECFDEVQKKIEEMAAMSKFLGSQSIQPEEFNPHFVPTGQSAILQKIRMDQLLLRPGIHLENLALVSPALKTFMGGILEESATGAEILIKYASYLEREQKWAESMAGLEQIRMRPDFEYRLVSGLSLEAAEKLDQHKPENLGQASRISGINPADLSVLMVHLNRKS